MRAKWIATALCWDGLLPATAAGCLWYVKVAFPKGHIAEVVAAALVPLGLALVRTSMAQRTLAQYFPTDIPLVRQLGIALAIIVLLVVEIMFGFQVFAPELHLLPAVVVGWLVYFTLILAATVPPQEVAHHECQLPDCDQSLAPWRDTAYLS